MKVTTTLNSPSVDEEAISSTATHHTQEIMESQHASGVIPVVASAIAVMILGATLCVVTLDGQCNYLWRPAYTTEQMAARDLVILMVEYGALGGEGGTYDPLIKRRLRSAMAKNGFVEDYTVFIADDDRYRQVESDARYRARDILARADYRRALPALVAALTIHKTLTEQEAMEIMHTAFFED